MSTRTRWLFAFTAFVLLGLPWLFGSPRFTGPDELGIAVRAAAVARGQLVGEVDEDIPYLAEVQVPATLGSLAQEHSDCWASVPLRETPLAKATSTCPDHHAVEGTEAVPTVQYRGQPFYFAVIGAAGALGTGGADPLLMRGAGLLMAAALLASASLSCAGARRPRIAGLTLFAMWFPATAYLAATTNPSGVEVAAALGAWAAGTRLATDVVVDDRVIHRFGVALVVLATCRGLGPAFVVGTLAVLALLAGSVRCREVAARWAARAWSVGLAVAMAASIAWVLWIQATYELHENIGSGFGTAVGDLPWYLRQMTVVFGSNTVALPTAVSFAWLAVAAAVAVVALSTATTRSKVIVGALAFSGLALNVTAAGLVLPNIGFYWQGRYALPVLVGAFVVAGVGSGQQSAAPAGRVRSVGPLGSVGIAACVLLLGAVHLAAFGKVASFNAGRTDPIPLMDALGGEGWRPPGGFAVLSLLVIVGIVATAVVTIVAPPLAGDHTMDLDMPPSPDESRTAR